MLLTEVDIYIAMPPIESRLPRDRFSLRHKALEVSRLACEVRVANAAAAGAAAAPRLPRGGVRCLFSLLLPFGAKLSLPWTLHGVLCGLLVHNPLCKCLERCPHLHGCAQSSAPAQIGALVEAPADEVAPPHLEVLLDVLREILAQEGPLCVSLRRQAEFREVPDPALLEAADGVLCGDLEDYADIRKKKGRAMGMLTDSARAVRSACRAS